MAYFLGDGDLLPSNGKLPSGPIVMVPIIESELTSDVNLHINFSLIYFTIKIET